MDDLRPRLEQALANQYVIERELGGGGMSRTYVAREKAFDRRVVVKVLAPELLAGVSVERFRREVLVAAKLQHPHVVPVLSTGDVDGLPWFTMPYVDGESLRQRLGQGTVSIGEAVGVLRDVARALAYAHGNGIVHRDIKPDNVLLSGGSATVTDFGIAKAISAARSEPGRHVTELTVAGTSIGTPTYMAPEQAAGDPQTDHRADLYAFGAMAYELLAGHPPFHGLSPAKLLAAHMGEVPKDLRAVRPDCPEPLAELVMRCLAKEPADRPARAADVVRVLDTITSSGAAAAVPSILAGGRIRLGKALGMWAAATALVALTAWAATDVIGLPEWVFPGSLGVMLAGLPVILTTWYVQRVVHKAYVDTPHFTPGGSSTAEKPQGTMATLAIKASPHLSWRRTWLGGGIAVGTFAALVLSFMVMRAMGIGPFGSLRGSGAFRDNETLVVADFRSPAGDSTLGATAAEALRTDLAQSRTLRVLTRANVREVLRLMQRPVDARVEFDLAREIATREGAKAVLDGGIERLGQSYVVSARLVSALDGSELANFRETASGEDGLLEALGDLGRRVRDKVGESFKSIRATKDLERVTTPSLPALRKYVEGSQVSEERGDTDRGLQLLDEAVAIDTGFAMAWRKIAVLLGNEGRERGRALEALAHAYANRERLTELERLLTEGYYFTRGPAPDHAKALQAYEAAAEIDSLSTSALNNAASILMDQREYQRAAELFRRVTTLPRTFGGAFTNLMRVQARLGDLDGLEATRSAFHARFPTSADLWEADGYVAWARGDLGALDSVARSAARSARTTRQAVLSNHLVGNVAALRGRPSEALAAFARGTAAEARATETAASRAWLTLDTLRTYAFIEERFADGRAVLDRALRRVPMDSIDPSERPWFEIARVGMEFRDPALVRMASAGYERDLATLQRSPEGRRAALRGMLAFAEGRYDASIEAALEADRLLAVPQELTAMQVGRAHDLAGRPDSAIVWFERFLAERRPDPDEDVNYRAGMLKRLGELYDAKGDVAKATEYFEAFVAMWANAEPSLQPKVREVQGKLERLRARATR